MPEKTPNDPYSDWLGIAPGIRPPYPHTLLGVEEGTQDADAINLAAKQQLEKLKNYEEDENPTTRATCSRLINEVGQAKKELLLDIQQNSPKDTQKEYELNEDTDPTDSGNGLSDSAIANLASLESEDGSASENEQIEDDANEPFLTAAGPSPSSKSKSADKLSIILLSLIAGAVIGAVAVGLILPLIQSQTSTTSHSTNTYTNQDNTEQSNTDLTKQIQDNESDSQLVLKNNQLQKELEKAQNHSHKLSKKITALQKHISKIKNNNLKNSDAGNTNIPKTIQHKTARIHVATLIRPLLNWDSSNPLNSNQRNILAIDMLDQAMIRLQAAEKSNDNSNEDSAFVNAKLIGNIATGYRQAGDKKSSIKVLSPLYEAAKPIINDIAKKLSQNLDRNDNQSRLFDKLNNSNENNSNLNSLKEILPALAGSKFANQIINQVNTIENPKVQKAILREILTDFSNSKAYKKAVPSKLLIDAIANIPKDNQEGMSSWIMGFILKNAHNYDDFADAQSVADKLSNPSERLIAYSKIALAQAKVSSFTQAANILKAAKKDIYNDASDSAKLIFISNSAIVFAKAKQDDLSEKAIKEANKILQDNSENRTLNNRSIQIKILRNLAIAGAIIGDMDSAETSWINALNIIKQPYYFTKEEQRVKAISKIVADQLIYGTKNQASATFRYVDPKNLSKAQEYLVENFIKRDSLVNASKYVFNIADNKKRLSILINILIDNAKYVNDDIQTHHLLSEAMSLARRKDIDNNLKNKLAAAFIYNNNIDQAIRYISKMGLSNDSLKYTVEAFSYTNHPFLATYYLSKMPHSKESNNSIECTYKCAGKTRQFALLSTLDNSTTQRSAQAYALAGLTSGILKRQVAITNTKDLPSNARSILTTAKLIP